LTDLTKTLYELRKENTHHYPFTIMDANGAPPQSYQFGVMPDNGIPALEFCRSVMSIINEIESKLK